MRECKRGKGRYWLGIAFLIVCILSIGAFPLFAAEEGEAHHEPEFQPFREISRFINFGIIVLILYFLLAKKMREVLRNRQTRIERSLTESQQAVVDAEAQLRSYEERIQNVDAEIAQIKQKGEQERAAALRQMEADAHKAADRVVQNARFNIQQEVEKAKASLQAEAAHLAVRLAEDLLKEQLQEADHQRLVRRYISEIGAKN